MSYILKIEDTVAAFKTKEEAILAGFEWFVFETDTGDYWSNTDTPPGFDSSHTAAVSYLVHKNADAIVKYCVDMHQNVKNGVTVCSWDDGAGFSRVEIFGTDTDPVTKPTRRNLLKELSKSWSFDIENIEDWYTEDDERKNMLSDELVDGIIEFGNPKKVNSVVLIKRVLKRVASPEKRKQWERALKRTMAQELAAV